MKSQTKTIASTNRVSHTRLSKGGHRHHCHHFYPRRWWTSTAKLGVVCAALGLTWWSIDVLRSLVWRNYLKVPFFLTPLQKKYSFRWCIFSRSSSIFSDLVHAWLEDRGMYMRLIWYIRTWLISCRIVSCIWDLFLLHRYFSLLPCQQTPIKDDIARR